MNAAVFLDRDGTITKKTSLILSSDELELERNVAEGISEMNALGLKVIVVTNQPQVARGLCTEEEVRKINETMVSMLIEKGAVIDAIYFCPHHPERHHADIPEYAKKYRVECECRKPNTGMLKKAAEDFGIDLSKSFIVGDRTVDILTGKNAGCRTILVKTGSGGLDGKHDIAADFITDGLLDASKLISSLMKPKIKAVILAGGRGERLMPMTKDMPKPMLEIGGKPALQHHVELAKRHGVSDIVMLTSYLGGKIAEYFGDGKKFGVSISYPHEPEPLGSGGAIKNAEPFLSDADHFIVLNGDVMADIDINELLECHLKNGGIVTLVLRETDHPLDSDIVELDKNRVVRYVGRGQDKHRVANTGIMVLSKKILDYIPGGFSNIEKDVIFKILDIENVFGFVSDAYIKDFGTYERLESVRNRYETNKT